MADTRATRRAGAAVAVGVVAALVVADGVVWAWACRRLDEDARASVAQAGWVLEAAPARWGGWPIAASVTYEGAVVRAGPGVVPPVTWQAERLTLRLAATAPRRLGVAADGAESIAVGAGPTVPFTAASLTGAIDLAGEAPPVLAAAGLRIDGPGLPVRADAATLELRPAGWSAALSGLTFPGVDGRPVDPAVATLRVDGVVVPPVRAMADAAASARDWRARGGQLALSMPALRWGALDASGRATVTLDAALQPVMDGTVVAAGLGDALRQLAANGALTPAAATAAGAMVTILAAPAPSGGLTLPVRLEGGVLSVARFPLLRFAPLQWE